ncbi:SWIM zinc finger protein [Undibacterium pigrum]|uniref:SWIM zinc finger protein n=2 Tax=Undibacterium pigrum TaxID=401470 RepID=A0A318J1J5_9BURK|nr:SWIM zinc finger protein [Undibacterium pigrum]
MTIATQSDMLAPMTTQAHAYHYLQASALTEDIRPRLQLATSGTGDKAVVAHPHFFEGMLKQPRLSAELLTAVHIIVGSRFFTPANTLAKNLMLADPVVTSGGGILRFEGFSSCCSAYVRVDMLPDSYEGDIVGKGTTNVDFNAPMRAALARVRDAAGLAFSVGQDAFTLHAGGNSVVEKKVELPLRWIRGMLEVQSYQAGMRKIVEVSGAEALRFLRSQPRASTSKTPLWISHGPFGLRTTTRPEPDSIRLVDSTRLRVLEALLPRVKSMAIFADEAQQASAWVLQFAGARLTLALSAEVWRGFSGEGQALRALMNMQDADALPRLRALLQWQSSLQAPALAEQLDLPLASIEDSLRILGVSGLLGFDVTEGSYFHRVLPLDLNMAEDLHPRLLAARELIKDHAVNIIKKQPLEASVQSADIQHRVREVDGELRCTCPWYARHQGLRGPCKHVLAVEAMTET